MARQKTLDAAKGRWKGILAHFGLDSKALSGYHCPCPLCGGKDRFRFDDQQGAGTYFCSGCGPGTGMQLVQKLNSWTFAQAAWEIDKMVDNVNVETQKDEQDAQQKRDYMIKLYRESQPVERGTIPWNYLQLRCPGFDKLPEDIRYHPMLKHSIDGGVFPGMLVLMRPGLGQKACGVHRTYLTEQGAKADVNPVRMSFGELGYGCFGAPVDGKLGVAEGIETALAAAMHFQMPVWSTISANGLQNFVVPEGVDELWIFADNDHSYTGQAAAFALARRVVQAGIACKVRTPLIQGTDWADCWRYPAPEAVLLYEERETLLLEACVPQKRAKQLAMADLLGLPLTGVEV